MLLIMTMDDVECNTKETLGEGLLVRPNSSSPEGLQAPIVVGRKHQFSVCVNWKILLGTSVLCFAASFLLSSSPEVVVVPESLSLETLSYTTSTEENTNGSLQWHIKPIKPYHHGKIVYTVEARDDDAIVDATQPAAAVDAQIALSYKRTFTVPCAFGVLVFNVGPAANYQPFAYDMYEDAYVFSNNDSLCVLYPSYQGIQTSDEILWGDTDPTEVVVDLGDLPSKISTRIVRKEDTKTGESKRGGDFVIMRSGNFYNPVYYKHLKAAINSWPDDDVLSVEERLALALAELDELLLE